MYLNNTRQKPQTQRAPKGIFLAIALIIVVILAGGFFMFGKQKNDSPSKSDSKQAAKQEPSFDKKAHSTTDPTSIWVVVNKKHPLDPKSYTPTDLVTPAVPLRRASGTAEMQLRAPAATALEELVAAGEKDGVHLMLASGYRSFDYQTTTYNSEVKAYGQAYADQESARPGYSEHQTGLGADLEPTSKKCEITDCFAATPEGKWLAANAYKYGFWLRYQTDTVSVTGYKYEPWHIRYVGTDLSNELHDKKIATLEKFFNITGGTSY